ncbi:MAG: sugar phosphate isomerase/epimerase [Verrucomicrobiae bacterium]|nr:sugar phosphate isomerase/epimerase [Verrucomicrobiae bacterium]
MGRLSQKLAVCSWSLQPANPQALIDALRSIGLNRIQIALDPIREEPAVWGRVGDALASAGIEAVSGMFRTAGEDYSTLDSIRRTGGVVPDATWDENWKTIREDAEIAADLGLKLVMFHAGFLPEDPADPAFHKLIGRLRQIADYYAEEGIELAFETGQETADCLKEFIAHLGRPNVGANFDPANMILYAKGDPIAALRTLGPLVKNVHVKDANLTKVPGTWGEEVPVGTGQVDWQAFFRALEEIGFGGDLCIEREAGDSRVADIRTAKEFVARIA